MSMVRVVQKGEIYRHFKGNLYQVVSVAMHSETNEQYVVYQALYGDMQVWVRPYEAFVSEVDRHKYPDVAQRYRFEAVSTLAGGTVITPPVQTLENKVLNEGVNKGLTEASKPLETEAEVEADNSEQTEEAIDKRLLAFLETDTYKEKLDYLSFIKNSIDDRLINDIAVALDIIVDEGPVDARYASLVSCLQTMAKFECGRLR